MTHGSKKNDTTLFQKRDESSEGEGVKVKERGRKVKFPSIAAVASGLRDINANVEGECDVRLQVYEDGQWALRWGLSDYDQDHRGFWGASSVPGINRKGRVSRFNSEDVARDLLDQAREAAAMNGESS